MEKLFEISSLPTGEGAAKANEKLPPDILELLTCKNGFFAFEAALEVFPATESSKSYSIQEWNNHNLWRCYYGDLAPLGVCFAQDVFGDQFIYSDAVYKFDSETAELSFVAASINIWAQLVLEDYDLLLGYSVAHDWQKLHGPVPFYHRLVPRIPFVLGGEYQVSNLDAVDSGNAMKERANLAVQLRDIPDGSEISFRVEE